MKKKKCKLKTRDRYIRMLMKLNMGTDDPMNFPIHNNRAILENRIMFIFKPKVILKIENSLPAMHEPFIWQGGPPRRGARLP
ncbi:MAG: hypothetical protein AMJ53_00750 [Gammaproteobacteria bacterium SG8_11]|nr:MAG: hypothetical protein AMJ53_00750 [Gammaproteobacteria bacterium SG8_11]